MGDRLATIDMARKLGAVPLLGELGGSPPNTMWHGPRPTSVPSLIHPTVWPQYASVTDRTDCKTVRPILSDRCPNGRPKRMSLVHLANRQFMQMI